MVPLLLGAYGLALPLATTDAIWLDEYITIYMVGGDPLFSDATFGGTLQRVIAAEPWPPLYYLLTYGWGQVAGYSPFVLRYLSLLFAMMSVGVMYSLGTSVGGRHTGLYAAGLLGTTTMLTYYAHELRGYALFMLLTLLSLWLYWLNLRGGGRVRSALLVFSLVLLLYTHYTAYVVGASLGIYHLLLARNNKRWGAVLFSLLLSALVAGLWAGVLVVRLGMEGALARSLDLGTIVYLIVWSFGSGVLTLLPVGLLIAAITVRGQHALFPAVLAGLFLVLALMFNAVSSFLINVRHIWPLHAMLILLIAVGLARAPKIVGGAFVVVWAVAGVTGNFRSSNVVNPRDDLVSLHSTEVDVIEAVADECTTPDDAFVFYLRPVDDEWLNDRVLYYYLHETPLQYTHLNTMVDISGITVTIDYNFEVPERLDASLAPNYTARAESYIDGVPHLWTFTLEDMPPVPQQAAFGEVLDTAYGRCAQAEGTPIDIRVYGDDVPACAPLQFVECTD